jgi:hypothetical protein
MATATKKREKVKLTTPVFRLSFPNLFEARASEEGGKPKFGASAIWTPAKFTARDKVLWTKMLAELDAEAKARFGKAWKDLPEGVRRGLRDGASKDLEGYGAGTRFANLTSKNKPGVIDVNKDPISPEEGNADDIYPGCYCRATVQVFSYDNKGKGVGIGLRAIQKVKDGPRLDSRVAAADDFDDEVDAEWMDQDDIGTAEDSFD